MANNLLSHHKKLKIRDQIAQELAIQFIISGTNYEGLWDVYDYCSQSAFNHASRLFDEGINFSYTTRIDEHRDSMAHLLLSSANGYIRKFKVKYMEITT